MSPLCKGCGVHEVAEKRKKNFCLQETETGLQLSRSHPYYMQCQLQMHVTGYKYCDFVVWHEASLHIERLLPDTKLITDAIAKAERFFTLCILPENGSLVARRKCVKSRCLTQMNQMRAVGATASNQREGRW